MATNDVAPKSLRVTPQGDVPTLSRPGGGRASAPLHAYVLHRWDWSETSLIVELFTRERGRVVVVAKGAKRPTSNFRAVLLPFHPIQVLLSKAPAEGHTEVHGLRSADWLGGQAFLPPPLLFSGFYANELLMKLLAREDPHAALFDAYAGALTLLAAGADEAPVLRAFELRLLRETGVLPELDTDALRAEALAPDARYSLQAQTGLVRDAAGLPGHDWAALQAALADGDMAQLHAACAAAGAALRVPLREVLHYHLGPAPLRTRQVWQGVQQLLPRRSTIPHESFDRP